MSNLSINKVNNSCGEQKLLQKKKIKICKKLYILIKFNKMLYKF